MGVGTVRSTRSSRRFLELLSDELPLREPHRVQYRQPEQQLRVPSREDPRLVRLAPPDDVRAACRDSDARRVEFVAHLGRELAHQNDKAHGN